MKKLEEILQLCFDKIIEFSKKYRFTSVLILIFSIFSIPLILTQCEFGADLGLENANEIGDAIGGTLGPYLSFIGSCLLAYTIYLQIEQRKDDEERYTKEKLRLENEAKNVNQKEFEKVIFENCLESLKSGEAKIHEINGVFIENRLAIYPYISNYFKKKDDAKTLKIGIFLNDINNAICLFNENKIESKAYQLIILSEIEIVMRLTRYSLIGIWNNKKKRTSGFTSFFFNHPHIERFNLIKNFYSNIRDFKVQFRNEFDASFQKVEILQLEETCTWFESIEPDFLEYWDLIFGEQEIAMPVGELEDKINIIRAKYNLP
jgi:hypothetical protein